MIEQAKFIYSLLRKVFENQIKTIEDQGQKQMKALFEKKEKSIPLIDFNKMISLML